MVFKAFFKINICCKFYFSKFELHVSQIYFASAILLDRVHRDRVTCLRECFDEFTLPMLYNYKTVSDTKHKQNVKSA